MERAGRMNRLFNKDVPFITYIIHDKNMKNGRTVTVYKPTQEYYILFELIKFRRLPSTFPDIGITVISEGLEPSPSDVSVTQDVLIDIKKDLSDAEDRTCPDCGGAGELAGDYFSSDGMFSCGRCQGRGTI